MNPTGLLLGLVCLAAVAASTAEEDVIDRFTARIHTTEDGSTLPYCWYLPPKANATQPVPLVILLHGTSGRGVDNQRQFTPANQTAIRFLLAQPTHPCAIAVPQCPPDDEWVRIDSYVEHHVRPAESGPTMTRLRDALYRWMRTEPIDTRRIYVIGNSMGGYGTWDLISRERLIAAAIPICGGGDSTQVERSLHIPTWSFHGAQDRVVPAAHSRRMVEAIRALMSEARYTEFPDAGHDIAQQVFATEGLADWLFAQRRP